MTQELSPKYWLRTHRKHWKKELMLKAWRILGDDYVMIQDKGKERVVCV